MIALIPTTLRHDLALRRQPRGLEVLGTTRPRSKESTGEARGASGSTLIPSMLGKKPNRAALMWATGLIAYFYAALRGLNPLCNYAFEHWLLTWDAGFIKRGLVGSLLHPVLERLPASEMRGFVTMLSLTVFTALSVLLLRAAYHVASVGLTSPWRSPEAWALPSVSLAFLSSSGVILAGSTLGFFDHLLLISAVLSIELVAHRRFGWVGMLCVFSLAVHEIFAVYGLPIVLFAMILQNGVDPVDEGSTRRWRVFGWLVPSLVLFAFITYSSNHIPAARLLAVRAELTSMGTLNPGQVDNAVYHLEHNLVANYQAQRGMIAQRVFDIRIDRVAWPEIIVLVGAALTLLCSVKTSLRRAVTGPFLVLVSVAPLLAHFVAWDATRFTNLAVMQSFAVLYAVVRILRPAPPGRRVGVILILLSMMALAASLYWKTPLMSGYVDGHGVIRVR